MDTITISNLSVHLPNGLGPSAFNLLPPPPCPALISMDIHLQPDIVPSCVEHDAMGGLGVNYSSVSKAVYAALTDAKTTFKRAEDVVKAVARVPLAIGKDVVQSVRVAVELPRAVLMAQSVVYAATFVYEQGGEWSCEIREIRLSCVVGLHPHERQERQRLEVDVSIHGYDIGAWSHRDFTNEVVEVRYMVSAVFTD